MPKLTIMRVLPVTRLIVDQQIIVVLAMRVRVLFATKDHALAETLVNAWVEIKALVTTEIKETVNHVT